MKPCPGSARGISFVFELLSLCLLCFDQLACAVGFTFFGGFIYAAGFE